MRKPYDISKVISGLIQALKSTPADKIDALNDTLDIDVSSDMWNAADRGNKPRTMTGPAERMSGDGAEPFVSHYSGATRPGDANTQGYTQLAEQLASTASRVEGVEKAVTSIVDLLKAVLKADDTTFPSSETKKPGKESDDRDDENDDDRGSKEIDKSGRLHVGISSVPALMASLAGRSRSGVQGLAIPPDMARIGKSKNSAALSDLLDDPLMSLGDRTDTLALVHVANQVAEGRLSHEVFKSRYYSATNAAKNAFDAYRGN